MRSLRIRYWSPHGRQEESKFKESDKKIDLVMRAAKQIDLSGLRASKNLEILDLSHNMLESIDLSPLSDCHRLKQLILHDNHISSIDLWPLAKSTSLNHLDLAANRLSQVDLTPLFLKCEVHLDASAVVNADCILRYLMTIEEIQQRFHLIRQDRAPWTAAPVVIWNGYRGMAKGGWNSIIERINAILAQISDRQWFAAQRGILEGLGLNELAGFDGNPSKLLEKTSSAMDYEDAIETIEETAIDLLEDQIESGGPTLFLEADIIRKTRASKLIPKILEARRREIEELRIPTKSSKVFLRSMWLTHYGYQILSALEMGLRTDLDGLKRIETCFREMGFEIKTKTMTRIRHSYPAGNSAGMKRHVFDSILGRLH